MRGWEDPRNEYGGQGGEGRRGGIICWFSAIATCAHFVMIIQLSFAKW